MDDGPYDVVIVGAGAAGSVLASRLSEDAARRILLIEAGPDYPPGHEPAAVADPFPVSMGDPRYWWPDLTAETGVDFGDGRRAVTPFIQGYGVGGGSLVNGMIAFRGFPEEYDGWAASGAEGWGWAEVLPYFLKLERDLDFSGPRHGSDGPLPVRRVRPQDWAPFSAAFEGPIRRRGYEVIADCLADDRDGLLAVPVSSLPDRRVSAAAAYLGPAVRARRNLTLMADARVERLLLEDGRAMGVQVRSGRALRRISAREVVVAGGAIWSPALLLRSGVGPAAALQAAGVPVAHDLPGVGRNLMNRPKVEIAAHLPPSSVQPSSQRAIAQNCWRYSSGLQGAPAHDMGLKFVNRTGWHPLGRRIGAVSVGIYQPFSKGDVILASPDPSAPPHVRFNLLSDERDLDRLALGLGLACELLAEPEVAAIRHEVFMPDRKIGGSLARRSGGNWARAAAIATLLDIGPLRRAALGGSIIDPAPLARDASALRELARAHAGLGWHVCGTCRMGGDGDPLAVVDARCRVRGVGGLRVVDASIFPAIAGEGGMQATVLMVAEKASDLIKAGWRAGAGAASRVLEAAR